MMDRTTGLLLPLLIIALASSGAAAELGPGDGDRQVYIVELEDSLDRGQMTELGAEIRYEYDIIDGLAIRATPATAESVRSLSSVGSVTPDIPVFLPTMDGDGDDTQRDSYNGTGVVAVLDTGVDDDHVDLDEAVISNEDVRSGSNSPDDRHGHGTHVASILAGSGEGNSEYRGLAPEARIRNYKVLDSTGSGDMSTVIEGIDRAVEDSDIIVLSLGAAVEECDGSDPLSQAVNSAAEQGVAVVTAAGNEGPEGQTITAPGCAEGAFTIGATQRREAVADYSSRGPTADGRVKPDIVAPGTNIMAAEAQTRSDYTSKSGTSMAAPYAAAAVVVLMGTDGGESQATYYGTLEDTADDLGTDANTQGSGLIDVAAAEESMADDGDSEDRDGSSEPGQDDSDGDTSGNDSDGPGAGADGGGTGSERAGGTDDTTTGSGPGIITRVLDWIRGLVAGL